MDEDTLTDLKQFIAATMAQQTLEMRQDFEKRFGQIDNRFSQIDKRFDELDKKIDDRIDEVKSEMQEMKVEIIDAIADTTNPRFDAIEEDTEQLNARVTKLETA